ncbi:MAG TPA: hypothetical protein VMU02_11705 [bacterium]|nr:hypothetical protein [bacterium]
MEIKHFKHRFPPLRRSSPDVPPGKRRQLVVPGERGILVVDNDAGLK